ncbi:MAG TPA: ATP-dependent DNA helicase [Lutibacter sp.]|nr:ATP-dependent DNA helicase [Lutibacter sp.]
MSKYIQDLNEPQQKAVLHKDGPMIIIAGAGSGKTRVLTYRIAYLMEQGIDPFNILSLTFTNKAAREMKDRIASVVGESESKNLWMGTFHSIFAKILRFEADKLGFPSNFTIYDAQDSQRLLSSIIKEMHLERDIYKTKAVASRISKFKNNLITVKAYYNNPELIEADAMAKRPKMGEIYNNYVERCFKSGAMDFDDLLLRTNELLTRFPAVLAKYQDRFRYILVDEYQDTNHSQYLIVKALADRFQNVCVVGDDSQSIYAFRGANIQNILNFQKDYPDAITYKLEQNYRSTKNIVLAANSVIDKNTVKLDKDLWTANDEGEKVVVMRLLSDAEEGRYIADSIFDNKNEKQLKNSEFAVLYRTNAQSRAVEDALRKKNIKYRIYGGMSFYQRKEIKDVLAYLRLLINQNDEEALKRVINYPGRGIGQTTLDRLTVKANEIQESIFSVLENIERIDIQINAGTKRKLADFVMLIKSFQIFMQKNDAFEVANEVVIKTRIVKDLEKDGAPEDISRVENIQELLNGVQDFIQVQSELEEGDTSMAAFLENVALATDFDIDKEETNVVTLMTVHMAKGLEFPVVYIAGLEEGLFPSAMNMNTREDLEEERRLFYVALTRAEKQAYLLHTQMRFRWGKLTDGEPSRFLVEIDEKYLDVKTPMISESRGNSFLDSSIFGDSPRQKVRYKKPEKKPVERFQPPKHLKKLSKTSSSNTNLFDTQITVGNIVSHSRFGKGEVLEMEGTGVNIKASIKFGIGVKKLLLSFAKLKVLS